MKKDPTILALETAVGGGSMAIRRGGKQIASIGGTETISRSEELLSNIKKLLLQCELQISNVDLVAVSRGPGSFTGIRIGIATALGLARSLSIPCIGVPLLDAIGVAHSEFPASVILPLGKNEAIWKTFFSSADLTSTEKGSVCSLDDIFEHIDASPDQTILVHGSLFEPLPRPASGSPRFENLGHDLAPIIAANADLWFDEIDLSPIYLHNPAKRSNLF